MREIRFRVWDEKTKEMIKDIHICPQYGWLVMSDNDALAERGRIPEEDLIWMQYTGLKDKNGVEIYEGDIVKINGWWDASGPAGYEVNECIVKWDEFTTGFEPMCNYDCDCDVYHKASECEVIGNIYDNKELLKEEGK